MRQSFEEYAISKSMVGKVAATWEDAFSDMLQKSGKDLGQIRILDFGCGDGRYFLYFKSKGLDSSQIYGTEVSKIRIQRCHDLGWHNAFHVEENQGLPFEDHYFDVVNMIEVIEHIPKGDIDFYMREITRVLKKDGFLIMTTPNYPIKRVYDWVDAFTHKQWLRLRDDPTHVSFYNQRKLKKLLSRYFAVNRFMVYKGGFIHKRIKRDLFIHKMMVVCSNLN